MWANFFPQPTSCSSFINTRIRVNYIIGIVMYWKKKYAGTQVIRHFTLPVAMRNKLLRFQTSLDDGRYLIFSVKSSQQGSSYTHLINLIALKFKKKSQYLDGKNWTLYTISLIWHSDLINNIILKSYWWNLQVCSEQIIWVIK